MGSDSFDAIGYLWLMGTYTPKSTATVDSHLSGPDGTEPRPDNYVKWPDM